ncbi:hypothetical protein [Flexivirga oryzae]|uniref:Uncharacterized protein n=1 Tax=Flexivirga oryzae TaxID=1794944 RepID=A0A839N6Y8_9MICO|nr:hypothetical protein [Flexivirga oryzae]MBB2891794.1 hypothetical protein [Flexivirga oryzae]
MFDRDFASGLLGGVTSAVIWISITLMTDMDRSVVGLWGLIFLIGVTVIATVITKMKSRQSGAD